MTPAPMLEATLQAQVLELAHMLGWLEYHTHDSRRSREGFPDLVLVHEHTGALLFVELKTDAKYPTPAQRRWLEALGKRHEALVWRPRDLRDGTVARVLQRAARPGGKRTPRDLELGEHVPGQLALDEGA